MTTNILIISISIVCIGYLIFKSIQAEIRNYLYIKYYESYTKQLEYYCDSSYEIFYKKHILSYTLENFTLDNEMLETLERSFVKFTLSLMGKRNERAFISYFGGEQYLIDNILMYVRNKIDHDNIVSFTKSMSQETLDDSKDLQERNLDNVFSDTEQ